MKFPDLYGIATVNEKGQVVIPAEARAQLGLKNGDKLLVLSSHNEHGLMLMKAEAIQALTQKMADNLSTWQDAVSADSEAADE